MLVNSFFNLVLFRDGYTIFNYGGGPNATLSPDGSGGFRYYEWHQTLCEIHVLYTKFNSVF